MQKHANGKKWINALIAYNTNSIIVRNDDNEYGQPGYLQMMRFHDGLGIAIMKKYIIPTLIRMINEKEISTNSKSIEVRRLITKTYLEKLINGPKIDLLLDVPNTPTEILNKPLDEKDKKIYELEKIIKQLEFKMSLMTYKLAEIEDMVLDMSIESNKI
jgi:hypothetical protein